MWRRGLMVGVLMGSLVGSAVAAAVVTGVTERVLDSGPTGDAEAAVLVPGPEGLILINPGSHALSSVPNLVNFQGILTEPGGLPVVDGAQSVTFRIYDAASGGAALWTETQSLTTAGGLFHTLLGSVTAFPAGVFNGTPRYLEVQVNADPPMTPRQQIVSVPYAFHAGTADSANTSDLASDVVCAGCVDSGDIGDGAILEEDVDPALLSQLVRPDQILQTKTPPFTDPCGSTASKIGPDIDLTLSGTSDVFITGWAKVTGGGPRVTLSSVRTALQSVTLFKLVQYHWLEPTSPSRSSRSRFGQRSHPAPINSNLSPVP